MVKMKDLKLWLSWMVVSEVYSCPVGIMSEILNKCSLFATNTENSESAESCCSIKMLMKNLKFGNSKNKTASKERSGTSSARKLMTVAVCPNKWKALKKDNNASDAKIVSRVHDSKVNQERKCGRQKQDANVECIQGV